MNRYTMFRHYWWLISLATVLAISLIVYFYQDGRMPLIGSVLATGLAFIYFVQQQRLAETSLFKELFTEFNSRYDKLNDKLVALRGQTKELTVEQKAVLLDYFNLCAEEYLFYKEGYIYPEVWTAWCRGMLWYLEEEPFRSFWALEERTKSYYGLDLDQIRRSAA